MPMLRAAVYEKLSFASGTRGGGSLLLLQAEYSRVCNKAIAAGGELPEGESTWLSARMTQCAVRDARVRLDKSRRWAGLPGSWAHHHGTGMTLNAEVALLGVAGEHSRPTLFIRGFVGRGKEAPAGLVEEIAIELLPTLRFLQMLKQRDYRVAGEYRVGPRAVAVVFEPGVSNGPLQRVEPARVESPKVALPRGRPRKYAAAVGM